MKLNLMELAYTEHLTAGTNDINSNNNCYTAKCNQKHNLQVSFELCFTRCQEKPEKCS